MLEAILLSGAVGFAVGTLLYLKKPTWLRRGGALRPRSPAEEVEARLRAVVPDELVESIEVDLTDERNPIALELSRDPSDEERRKIDTACSRAIRELIAEARGTASAETAPPAEARTSSTATSHQPE